MTYDERQREVIEATGGYHLVLAAPGCGKTEVLAERIRRAAERGIRGDDMLCLTFTNRAARSMTERIARLTAGPQTQQLYVGNIHRFCSKLLFDRGIVPAESAIIDDDDSISILADIMSQEEQEVAADNRQRHRCSEMVNLSHFFHQYAAGYPKELMVHYSAVDVKALRAICDILRRPFTRQAIVGLYADIEEVATLRQLSQRDDTRLLIQDMQAASRYAHYKQQHDLLDFEDLLLRVYELPDDVLPRYHWIQVDEIQDLNPLQLAIIDRLTAADDFTVMYLGDNQQAIFSFMGAQTATLNQLAARCTTANIHHLQHNYRSPKYLLDVYNEFGRVALGIEPALLPQTAATDDTGSSSSAAHTIAHEPEDLQILMAPNNIDECAMTAQLVKRLTSENEQQTTAVIVSYNAEADEMSTSLHKLGIDHFKVSGRDLFAEPGVRLLLAHLNVMAHDNSFLCWSRIFVGMKAMESHAAARAFTARLARAGLTPADFLGDSGESCLQHFVGTWQKRDIVVFDTETTGLDVYEDDIVQIAAVRIRQGELVGGLFNVFIETGRTIPPMLGDTPNPLLDEYQHRPHLRPGEAFSRFLSFADGAVLLAHNADFDYHILDQNLRRRCVQSDLCRRQPECLDSLRIARLIAPRLKSHRLKDLLVAFHLEGQNSHMADDDIMATVSLVRHCYAAAQPLLPRQREIINTHRRMLDKFRAAYLPFYRHTKDMLWKPFPADEPPAIVTELAYIYNELQKARLAKPVAKMEHLMAFLAEDMVRPGERSLIDQLHAHLTDINTYKESDLCGSSSMRERVFVSTVHKAKGLEFDNVVLLGCTDNNYPGFFARQTAQGLDEERRRFYVALSRARRRLFLTWSQQKINGYGRVFRTQLSPYTVPLQRFFLMRSF